MNPWLAVVGLLASAYLIALGLRDMPKAWRTLDWILEGCRAPSRGDEAAPPVPSSGYERRYQEAGVGTSAVSGSPVSRGDPERRPPPPYDQEIEEWPGWAVSTLLDIRRLKEPEGLWR